MTQTDFDVLGIGNAIVDVLAQCDDAFLDKYGLAKGAMTLIDEPTADALYVDMEDGVECSGGSAANTIACVAGLGGRGAFVGKVKDDTLGNSFSNDIKDTGVHFETPMAADGVPTARCLVFVTPDAQRTMQTYLGACVELTADDVDPDLVYKSEVTYLEGYLWDPEDAKQAFIKASMAAHRAGRKVSATLSDPFCVDRHRDSFLDLVETHVDVLFANEEEIKSLYQVSDFDDALQAVREHCHVAALTRGEKGCVIVTPDELHIVDAAPVSKVLDTTGAGDAFAAGFLHAYTRGKDLKTCGKVGGLSAAEVISHYGARPQANLAELAAPLMG